MTPSGAAAVSKANTSGYKVESPFLNLSEMSSYEQNEAQEAYEFEQMYEQNQYQIEPEAESFESPFVFREFAGESVQSEQASPSAPGHVMQFLSELHDHQFNEALYELYAEAEQFHDEQGFQPTGHFEQLAFEAEQMLDRINQGIGSRNFASMQEGEMEAVIQQFEPETAHLSPQFENFLGKVFNKVKSIAKGAVDLAKKGISMLPIGSILSKLKALVRPLLSKVLRFAISKLPASLQGPARMLQAKFLNEAEAEAFIGELEMEAEAENESEAEQEMETVPDIGRLQHEFDSSIALHAFGAGEFEHEFEQEWGEQENEFEQEDPLQRLHDARETLVRQIGELRDGENPGPVLEQFIPAVLPLLKLGISIIGRPKVVKFLAGCLATLIEPVVKQPLARMLALPMVDIGLKFASLETSAQSEAQAGANAVAAAVEDTVREVAMLPETVLENEELLQGYIQSAFEAASSANFPPAMLRPELRETSGLNGTWMMMPSQSSKKFYKKYSKVIEITLTPQMMKAIHTFGNRPLSDFLRDHQGIVPNKSVKARLHLYEAIMGTTLSRIARMEKHVPGLGVAGKQAWSQLHPLTPESAGILFREPGLGRKASRRFRTFRRKIAAGKRFYYLEIAGARVQVVPKVMPRAVSKPGVVSPTPTSTLTPAPRTRRSNQANVTIDFPRKQVRVFLFVSEADSQQISAKIRQGMPATSAVMVLKSFLKGTIKSAFSGEWRQHVKIVQEYEAQEQFVGGLAKKAGTFLLQKLGENLWIWLEKYLQEYFKTKSAEFAAAAAKDADGVTIMITIMNPPGLGLVQSALKGNMKSMLGGLPSGIPNYSIKVIPGYRFH
ncbi:hypothetical protein A8990_10923 [Paenibacillus taihuensis]|uniref:Uncharacterized protein n=1 Tax=Paenibacillus taihuensis TaxID=1156355 RepID=A0A3D9S3N3_9BACL|nr:hypothetical protein [Paenibacillus taihuensis]REE87378.1 hypothetical protein A8990_10923 [Paenibacillus taihuensis]